MRREKIVPVRLTESEYQKLLDLVEKYGEKNNVSLYIRNKIFAEQKEKNDYRELLILIRQIRADINHSLKLYQKDFLTEAQEELEYCSKMLDLIQKEMMEHGSNSVGTHEGE